MAKDFSVTLNINPLNAKLNPICHLLALLGAHPILHISRVRVKIYILLYAFFLGNSLASEFYIDIFINCSWVVTWWQYTFTHKQYTEQPK
jgi:hypothetical protein